MAGKEKGIEKDIIKIINMMDKSYAFNANNIPVPIMDRNRKFHGFRANSHEPGLSDINGILQGRPIYIETKTPNTIKTFWKDVECNDVWKYALTTQKRIWRHKDQHNFLEKMKDCDAFTGVVASVKEFLYQEWWEKIHLNNKNYNLLLSLRNNH